MERALGRRHVGALAAGEKGVREERAVVLMGELRGAIRDALVARVEVCEVLEDRDLPEAKALGKVAVLPLLCLPNVDDETFPWRSRLPWSTTP